MSDKIKRAARERMARTGEPYTLARRMVIEERERHEAQPAEPQTPEPFFAFTDEHGEFLSRLLGPLNPEPSSGPPYTHVHRLPDPDDDEADEDLARLFRPYTITRDGA